MIFWNPLCIVTTFKGKLKGSISLPEVQGVYETEDKLMPNCFCVLTPERNFVISASSTEIKKEWMEAIDISIKMQTVRKNTGSMPPPEESVIYQEPELLSAFPGVCGRTVEWVELIDDNVAFVFMLPMEFSKRKHTYNGFHEWLYLAQKELSENEGRWTLAIRVTIEEQGGEEYLQHDFSRVSSAIDYESVQKTTVEDLSAETVGGECNSLLLKDSPLGNKELQTAKKRNDLYAWELWTYNKTKKILFRFQCPFEAYAKGMVQVMNQEIMKSIKLVDTSCLTPIVDDGIE